jgi:sarcosine oxidase / L-pipecolate oxidase
MFLLLLLVVRSSYDDPFYAELAADAIQAWKDKDTWDDVYHEFSLLLVIKSSIFSND